MISSTQLSAAVPAGPTAGPASRPAGKGDVSFASLVDNEAPGASTGQASADSGGAQMRGEEDAATAAASDGPPADAGPARHPEVRGSVTAAQAPLVGTKLDGAAPEAVDPSSVPTRGGDSAGDDDAARLPAGDTDPRGSAAAAAINLSGETAKVAQDGKSPFQPDIRVDRGAPQTAAGSDMSAMANAMHRPEAMPGASGAATENAQVVRQDRPPLPAAQANGPTPNAAIAPASVANPRDAVASSAAVAIEARGAAAPDGSVGMRTSDGTSRAPLADVRAAAAQVSSSPASPPPSMPVEMTSRTAWPRLRTSHDAPLEARVGPTPTDRTTYSVRTFATPQPAAAGTSAPMILAGQSGPSLAGDVVSTARLPMDGTRLGDGAPDLSSPVAAGASPATAAATGRYVSASPLPIVRQIANSAPTTPGASIEITLSPEELGRVRMTIVASDAGMVLSLHADRDETLALLRRHADALAQEFRNAGLPTPNFDFGGGGNGRRTSSEGPPAGVAGMRAGSEQHAGSDSIIAGTHARSTDRLDIRM